jgi:S-formylglutathione hydrolase FrmB
MRCLSSVCLVFLAACNGTEPTPTDAGGDRPGKSNDASNGCSGELEPGETLVPRELWLTPGSNGAVEVHTVRNRCSAVSLGVVSSMPTLATPSVQNVRISVGESTGTLSIRAGTTPGDTVVAVGRAMLPVHVVTAQTPTCPMDTTAVTGRLVAGANLHGAPDSPLQRAGIAAPMTATEITAVDVSIACAPDQVPDGYVALGPAVRFDPSNTRLPREIPFTLPINPALVTPRYEMQIQVAYTAPGFRTPRVAPVADLHYATDARTLTFKSPRLGTYQAIVRRGLGTERVRRRFTYHGIVGFSMGAAGTGLVGTRHLDRFDFVAPLGGPIEWAYQGNYIRTYHTGGFCTAAERALDPTGCARGSSADRTPPVYDILERKQHFEEWFFPDGWDGQGGTFDRRSYVQIFRDLSRMFGNGVVATGTSGILPRGVPESELMRTDEDRCARSEVIERFYDARYNPDGSLPVITFCDGTHAPQRAGLWDNTRGNFPMEITLAVDVNRNGRRDAGEPLIVQSWEPFRDVGSDGVSSEMEPGYNATTHPDPAGDNYDRQFNPSGTEGNYVHEDTEPYDDLGLDGVRCPGPGMCPHDVGEGNGRFDITQGASGFLEMNPRGAIARAPIEQLQRTEFWIDGGVRDLFLFGAIANHFGGVFQQRGFNLHYYNNFAPIGAERVAEDPFPFTQIDWGHLPGHVVLRYGSIDADQRALVNGDGGHVGTVSQITNRLYSAMWWMGARWPGGDRSDATFSFQNDNAGRCATGYACTYDFRSPRANRTGPVSVYLPPGYHDPKNANVRYPVVFVLHGYGQEPQNLLATGFIIGNYMVLPDSPSWQRMQKVIMVFPDGRCRPGDNCLRGTFYANSPVGSAQMETYVMDLVDHIDQNFRVKAPEEVEVVR